MRKIYVPSGAEVTVTKGEIWGNDQGQSIRRAIKDPLLFVTSGNEPYSWITTDANATDSAAEFWPSKTNRKKTAYDPCPAGWMLPVYDESGNSPYSFWTSPTDEVLKTYPAAGRLKFDFKYAEVGSSAVLWCGDPTGLKTCSAYINFDTDRNITGYDAVSNHSRANALPVRCVKIK